MEKTIAVKSFWGVTIQNEYFVQDGDTLAVLLPGGRYTLMAPLMYYAYNAAKQTGLDILAIEYGFQKTDKGFERNETTYSHLISETREAISKCLAQKDYKKIVFIGKCVGTYIQSQLADAFAGIAQKHIFITPWPECIEGIKKTNCLVIAGSDDEVFKKEHIDRITNLKNAEVKIIEGANHDLEKDGFKESLAILTDVTESIYHFIRD